MRNVLVVLTVLSLFQMSAFAKEQTPNDSLVSQCSLTIRKPKGVTFTSTEDTQNLSDISFKEDTPYLTYIQFKVFSATIENGSLSLISNDKKIFLTVDINNPESSPIGTVTYTQMRVSSYLNGEHGAGTTARTINWYVLGLGYITLDVPKELGIYSMDLLCR